MNNFFWQIVTRCTLQSFVKYHNYHLSIVMTNYKEKQSINLYYMDLRKCVQFCKTYRLPQSLLFSFICTWKSSIKSRFCVFPLLVQRKRAESSDCRFVHATVFETTWYRKTFWERDSLHLVIQVLYHGWCCFTCRNNVVGCCKTKVWNYVYRIEYVMTNTGH